MDVTFKAIGPFSLLSSMYRPNFVGLVHDILFVYTLRALSRVTFAIIICHRNNFFPDLRAETFHFPG